MRLIGTIPHADYRIVVYDLENHLYVEFEAGPMKQGYKWPKSKVQGIQQVAALLDDPFHAEVRARFDGMYHSMKERLDKIQPKN